jgi:hypothetical protein
LPCEFISLQQQCHTYITSWFTQGLALLRPVNLSRQLRRPQRHAPTTPLPLPKSRAEFIQVRALHPLPNSTGPYLAVIPYPPSCSTNPHGRTAAIFYLSSRRQPTAAPSCFSLSNQVSYSSGTPTYAVHLLRPVNPSRQLCGHSITLQLLLYHYRNGLNLCRSQRYIHYQNLWVHT